MDQPANAVTGWTRGVKSHYPPLPSLCGASRCQPQMTCGTLREKAGSRLAAYVRETTSKPALGFLSERASALKFDGQPVSVTPAGFIGPFDVGGYYLNDSLMFSRVLFKDNPALRSAVSSAAGVNVTDDNSPAMLVSFRYVDANRTGDEGAPVLGYNDQVHVLVNLRRNSPVDVPGPATGPSVHHRPAGRHRACLERRLRPRHDRLPRPIDRGRVCAAV
jgi:hypothetical protein